MQLNCSIVDRCEKLNQIVVDMRDSGTEATIQYGVVLEKHTVYRKGRALTFFRSRVERILLKTTFVQTDTLAIGPTSGARYVLLDDVDVAFTRQIIVCEHRHANDFFSVVWITTTINIAR